MFYLRKDLIELPRKLNWISGTPGGKVKEKGCFEKYYIGKGATATEAAV